MKSPLDDLLTVDDLARALQCTTGRVRQLIRSGRLPARKLGRWVWVTDRESLDLYTAKYTGGGPGRKRVGYRPEGYEQRDK